MADKPQEPTWVRNNQDVRKYVCLFTIALIAFNSLFTCFVMFVMPSKEITVKLFDTGDESKTKIILEHRVGDADTANNAGIHDNIDTIMTKLSKLEADGKVYKELKMKIEKLEDQLNENLFPNTCDEKESTCSDHGDNFKTFMTEIKKDVDMEIKSKLAELQIHIDANELGQKSSTDSGSTWEYFMMKLAEMESHFTTRDETKQKTTELEQRIDDVQALIDEKKPVSIIHFYITNRSRRNLFNNDLKNRGFDGKLSPGSMIDISLYFLCSFFFWIRLPLTFPFA